jgi:hypothetical protein
MEKENKRKLKDPWDLMALGAVLGVLPWTPAFVEIYRDATRPTSAVTATCDGGPDAAACNSEQINAQRQGDDSVETTRRVGMILYQTQSFRR